MRTQLRPITTLCSLALIGATIVPAFAQSNIGSQADNVSQPNIRSQLDAPTHLHARRVVLTTVRPALAVREFRPIAHELPRVSLPATVQVPAAYRDLVALMLERSPAFRRQCLRLANAPHVHVRVLAPRSGGLGRARARTDIVRTEMGGMNAVVQLQRSDELAELIAHEFEHILEQMDGVDLRVQAQLPGTGVRWCDDGSFETVRAERIGALVAAQTRGH